MLQDLEMLLSSIKINAYIFGDFNINTMKPDQFVSDFISMVKSYNYYFVNTSFPTRNQALIDHFLINNHLSFELKQYIITDGFSDHAWLLVDCCSRTDRLRGQVKELKRIDFVKAEKIIFNSSMRHLSVPPYDSFERFYSTLESVREQSIYIYVWLFLVKRLICPGPPPIIGRSGNAKKIGIG